MSKKAVSEVVGLLVVDAEFRKQFKADPNAALRPFDLTGAEQNALKKLKDKDLASMSVQDIAGALAGTVSGNIALAT